MVLVLNFFLKDVFANTFNQVIQNQLDGTNVSCKFIRISATTTAKEIQLQSYSATHLILSGSEASTLDDMGWEKEIQEIVTYFIENKMPILGICYGHQLLVRLLAGKKYLQKSPNPEIGWGHINIVDNPLFSGIKDPVCLLAHYDEAIDLPENFHILGSSSKCAIHGFQYKELPVWGVQFHPEYDPASGQELFDDLKANDPHYHAYYENKLTHSSQLQQNKLFFTNFVTMT
ncbi:GMP synthase (glutamine-hydrolysing) [Tindallia magadiensis]|uniref:GMP synthase (Glutamine-hydrolysing) n=1 Tax=Tindallia magadiensis TaxID=69895 RepID=A0A1I3FEE0_9FIRM|nr:gamma-glutamyl-gamma-aminobutyrate hydrolase family protein [Tindallia magadiensis]SFI09291.1 GMP synthase (glutamine-hydrolysing) [Tindallia magadiensis]